MFSTVNIVNLHNAVCGIIPLVMFVSFDDNAIKFIL